MEHQNYSEQVAFVAASLVQLADMSDTALEELAEFVGVATISELLAIDSLWADLSYEEMAKDICIGMEWEPSFAFPSRRDAELYWIGRLIAKEVSAAGTTGGTEAERLFSILSSGGANWMLIDCGMDDPEGTEEEITLPF